MKTFDVRRCLIAVRTQTSSLSLLKYVFPVDDEEAFERVLNHLRAEGFSDTMVLRLLNAYRQQDQEMLAYLLLAETQKIEKLFFEAFGRADDFIAAWPELRDSFLPALSAVAMNQQDMTAFMQKFLDAAGQARLFVNASFLEAFSEAVSETLGFEVVLSLPGQPQNKDWYASLFETLNDCKYALVALAELRHAIFNGTDKQFDAWMAHLQEFFRDAPNLLALQQLRENLDDDDAEEIDNLFETMIEEVCQTAFAECFQATPRLSSLAEEDMTALEELVCSSFSDMVLACEGDCLAICQRMALLLAKWGSVISEDFIRDVCDKVPSEQAYLFVATLAKFQNRKQELFADENMLKLLFRSQRPNCN